VLVLLDVEASAVKEFWVLSIKAGPQLCHHGVCRQGCLPSRCLLSRRVLDFAIKVGVIEVGCGLCCQGGCGFPADGKAWRWWQGLEVAGRSGMEVVDRAVNTVCHQRVCYQRGLWVVLSRRVLVPYRRQGLEVG
jgi:hypothetical protein